MEKARCIWVYMILWKVALLNRFIQKCKLSDQATEDINVWIEKLAGKYSAKSKLFRIGYCIVCEKAIINVLLNRFHRNPCMYLITRALFKPLESLYINMPPENIGGGLYFQHGFSTVIAAKKIGKNCTINQQVTIGYNETECATIGDNVVISAGAIVIGGISVGNNSVIGAGAVVTHDVEQNVVVAGVPAVKIRDRR